MTTPTGRKTRKYLYGQDRDELYERWIELQNKARKGPVASRVPTLGQYIAYWLAEVVEPTKAPATFSKYETLSRLYIVPALGSKRLDRLQVRDVQTWLNRLPRVCQCCAQHKNGHRPRAQ